MGTKWKEIATALCLVGAGWQVAAAAERDVYRCSYPGGLIEFRGVPVPGGDCVLVERTSVPASSAPSGFESQTEPATQADGSAEPRHSDDPRAQNCNAAQHNLGILEGEGPVVSTGPDGQDILMSDDERAAMLRQTRRDVEYWCEDP